MLLKKVFYKHPKILYHIHLILLMVFGWYVSIRYFLGVRHVGIYSISEHIKEEKVFQLIRVNDGWATIGAIMIGLLTAIFELNLYRVKRKGIGPLKLNLLRIAGYFLSFIIFYLFAVSYYYVLINDVPFFVFLNRAFENTGSITFWAFIMHGAMTSLFISFYLQAYKIIGPGIVGKIVTGRYNSPKEEDRVFMFLDLTSSTAFAEKLGHVKYSRLIQDCFYDMTDFLIRYRGRIYQYVGDEAVITWNFKHGFPKNRCIHFYFDYAKRLKERKDYYLKEYGIVPSFKAAVNSGRVTVCEVGEIKTELAYHGDVLNTAARILDYGKKNDHSLMISEEVFSKTVSDGIKMTKIEDLSLKGKTEKLSVYKVERPRLKPK